jgi:hypothetical protein
MKQSATVSASSAFRFVLTMGIVNLFADMTCEGGTYPNRQFILHVLESSETR